MYLVAEWRERCAPNSIGRCKIGVAKQLSTTRMTPFSAANFPSHLRSTRSTAGFVGVSTKIMRVFSRISPGHESGSAASTYVCVIPNRGRIVVRMVWVDPKSDRHARM